MKEFRNRYPIRIVAYKSLPFAERFITYKSSDIIKQTIHSIHPLIEMTEMNILYEIKEMVFVVHQSKIVDIVFTIEHIHNTLQDFHTRKVATGIIIQWHILFKQ